MSVRSGYGLVCIAALLLHDPARAQEGTDELRETVDASAGDEIVSPPVEALQARAIPSVNTLAQTNAAPRRRARQEPTEKLGIGNGPVKFFAKHESGFVVSTNPQQAARDGETEIGLRQAVRFKADADWARHDLVIDGGGEIREFFDQTEASTRSADITADMTLDIRSTTSADLRAGYFFSDSRDTSEPETEPRADHTFTASAGITHNFGPVLGRANLRLTRFFAEDLLRANGTREDNDDRAYVSPAISTRLTFAPQNAFNPFVELEASARIFDEEANRFGERRNSHDLRVSVGTDFSEGEIWDGSIAATYLWRGFDEAGLEDDSTIGLTGSITWSPRRHFAARLTSDAGMDFTRVPGSSAEPFWNIGFTSLYQVTDDVDLRASVSVLIEDDGGPLDTTTEAGLGVEWRMNTFTAFSLRGEYEWFDGGDPGTDYEDARLIGTLILQR